MAIARGTAQSSAEGVSSTRTITGFTVSGSDVIGFVAGWSRGSGNNPTSITWNGTSMTQIGASPLSLGAGYHDKIFLYYLASPTTGDITLTLPSSDYNSIMAVTYTGAKQTGIPDASNDFSQGSASTLTNSVTTTVANCWTIMPSITYNGRGTAGTGSTAVGSTSLEFRLFDSNGPIATPSSYSMTVDFASDSASASRIVSFAPSASTATTDAIMFGHFA